MVFGLTIEQVIAVLAVLTGGSLISALISIYTLNANKKSIEAQAQNSNAQAIAQYIKALSDMGGEMGKFRAELGRLRNEILKRDQVIDHQNSMLMQKNVTIEDLRRWAAILIALLAEHAPTVPVPEFTAREVVVGYTPEINTLSEDAEIPTVPVPVPVIPISRKGIRWQILSFITKILTPS